MKQMDRLWGRRINPRTLGAAALALALGSEAYLTSLPSSGAEPIGATAPAGQVTAVSSTTTTVSPALRDDRAAERFAELFDPPALRQIPLCQLRTNPFRQVMTPGTQTHVDAASRRQGDEERAAVLKGVAALELQSVTPSPGHDTCMINGVICQEGQQIDGFTVEMISSRSVTVSSGIYRFELIPKP